MQAVVLDAYGGPGDFRIEEIEEPTPKADEVLVRNFASSVNAWDRDMMKGEPFITRLESPRRPKHRVLGADVAGRVEAVGKDVARLQVGDRVFGDVSGCGFGGFAEYVCARENAFAAVPAGMSYEQAAALPQAGLLALQGLRNKAAVQSGEHVLVNGGGGGCGTIAIQLAKALGAEVTAVDSTQKLEMMRSIGADHVVDYTQEDIASAGRKYDVILDVVTFHSVLVYKRLLNPGGRHVIMGGGSWNKVFQAILLGPLAFMGGDKQSGLVILRPNAADLETLGGYFVSGRLVPVIHRIYTLEETLQALHDFDAGIVQGKAVIRI